MLVHDALLENAAGRPDKTAIIDTTRELSYGAVAGRARRLGAALRELGVERGERVAVCLENSLEAVIGIYGILCAGAVFVPLNPTIKASGVAYIVDDCDVKVLITDRRHETAVIEAAHTTAALRHVVITDYAHAAGDPAERGAGGRAVSRHDFEHLIEHTAPLERSPATIDIDRASIMYTSGSTGRPRGVVMTHLSMVTAIESITTYLENTAEDRILNSLPLSFDYGLYQVLMALSFGGSVVLERGFAYPSRIVELLRTAGITGFPLVPAYAAILRRFENLEGEGFGTVRYLTNTGQALTSADIAFLRSVFTNARLYSMYGLTECKRALFLPPGYLDTKPLSVGVAIPNTEAWLEDPEGNRIDRPGVSGELVVRGSHVMQGYWGLPEETERVLGPGRYPRERVLRTGDLFHRDEEGFFYFEARLDDVFKSGGERIGPREIEEVLSAHPAIVQAAVVAAPDPVLGNAIKAFVVSARSGPQPQPEELMVWCRERLESHKVPKYVTFLDELPRTGNGKVDRRALCG
jgi:amino acid adenylation domain-containing protein